MTRGSSLRAGARLAFIAALLVLAVAAVYGQTARHEFLSYDDDVYITNNPMVDTRVHRPGSAPGLPLPRRQLAYAHVALAHARQRPDREMGGRITTS